MVVGEGAGWMGGVGVGGWGGVVAVVGGVGFGGVGVEEGEEWVRNGVVLNSN